MTQRTPATEAAYWDLHARRDPLWAVLSDSGKAGRQWALREFMATGEREISVLFHHLERIGIAVPRGRALDFGCGIGRLTQAIGRRFTTVLGIDISPRMVALAGRLNQHPTGVDYRVHDSPDISALSSIPFDFIYSNIVLQHIEPAAASDYLRSFVRGLSTGGMLVFQLPSHRAPEQAPITAMPTEAYAVALRPPRTLETVAPATDVELRVSVVNQSPVTWQQDKYGPIRLGNHWLSASGEMLVQDDGRAQLPSTFEAGAECVLRLPIKTPSRPGSYLLELDLVHEGVTWFAGRSDSAVRLPVSVGAPASNVPVDSRRTDVPEYAEELITDALEPLDAVPAPGEFPMNAIDRETTIRILEEAGGVVLRTEEDDHARPDWISYRYFVRRSN